MAIDQRRIEQIVAAHRAAGEIDGAVVLFARNGAIECLTAEGHSGFDPSFTFRTDTVFNMMSMTKPFAAACALMLVSDGVLGIDDPVSRWIPEFALPREVRTLKPGEKHLPFPPVPGDTQPPPAFDHAPANREITVRDILSFTSGLQTIGVPNPTLPDLLPHDSLASWVAKLGPSSLEFQPGTQWHYSNATGYDILGRIIELASGQDLADFARQRLFEPLGMTDTAFGRQPRTADRVPPLGPFATFRIMRPDYASGSAGLFSTASDYWRFAQMLLEGGSFDGRRIMSEEAVAAMHTNQIGNLPFSGIRAAEYARPIPTGRSSLRYGYGVGIVEAPTDDVPLPSGSFGWDGIGTRRFWVIPQQNSVLIMLASGLGSGADNLHQHLERAATGLFDEMDLDGPGDILK